MFDVDALVKMRLSSRPLADRRGKRPKQSASRKNSAVLAGEYVYASGSKRLGQKRAAFQNAGEANGLEFGNIAADAAAEIVLHPLDSFNKLKPFQLAVTGWPAFHILVDGAGTHAKALPLAAASLGGYVVVYRPQAQIRVHWRQQGVVRMSASGETRRWSNQTLYDSGCSGNCLRMTLKTHRLIMLKSPKGSGHASFDEAISLYGERLSSPLDGGELPGQGLDIPAEGRTSYAAWHVGRVGCGQGRARLRQRIALSDESKPRRLSGGNSIASRANLPDLKQAVEACERLGNTTDGKTIHVYRHGGEKSVLIRQELRRLSELEKEQRAEGRASGGTDGDDDDHYYRLLIWDTEKAEIAAAYRFMPIAEQLDNGGVEGLSSCRLFSYRTEMAMVLERGIELGRGFVRPGYRQARGNDYLWQGIGAYLVRYPQYRYLLGMAAIPARGPAESHQLLVSFYRRYFSPGYAGASARHACPAVPPRLSAVFDGNNYHDDLGVLKSRLSRIESEIPPLCQQYAQLCERGGVRFIDFSVDPDSSGDIVGLAQVDVCRLRTDCRQRYMTPHIDH